MLFEMKTTTHPTNYYFVKRIGQKQKSYLWNGMKLKPPHHVMKMFDV